jgi:hypothetical protein
MKKPAMEDIDFVFIVWRPGFRIARLLCRAFSLQTTCTGGRNSFSVHGLGFAYIGSRAHYCITNTSSTMAAVCLLLLCTTASWGCSEALVHHHCGRHLHGIATTAFQTRRPPCLLFLRSTVKSNTAADASLPREEQRDNHHHVIQTSKNASKTIASLVLDELGRRRRNDEMMEVEKYSI